MEAHGRSDAPNGQVLDLHLNYLESCRDLSRHDFGPRSALAQNGEKAGVLYRPVLSERVGRRAFAQSAIQSELAPTPKNEKAGVLHAGWTENEAALSSRMAAVSGIFHVREPLVDGTAIRCAPVLSVLFSVSYSFFLNPRTLTP